MAQEIIHIDDLCGMCGYFANNEPETHNGHNYGCDHRDNMDGDKQCMASACPLGWLAEAEHFMEINGCSKEEERRRKEEIMAQVHIPTEAEMQEDLKKLASYMKMQSRQHIPRDPQPFYTKFINKRKKRNKRKL